MARFLVYDVAGFSILEADSAQAVLDLRDDHPHFLSVASGEACRLPPLAWRR